MERLTHHPDDLALLSLAEGDEFDGAAEVADHVGRCAECKALTDELLALTPTIKTRTSPLPAPVRVAMQSPVPEPSVGQLWRCEWDQVVELVWIISVAFDTSSVEVLPVVDAEQSSGSVLSVDKSLLGWAAAVQLGLPRTLPTRVLDTYLGQLSAMTERSVRPRVISPRDPRAAVLADAEDNLDRLSSARWIPEATESPLTDILTARWASPSTMSADTGIDARTARALLSGQHVATDAEMAALSAAGVTTEATTTPPPLTLQHVLDSPRIRPLWRDDAARHQTIDSPEYRWEQYTNNRFALAARTSGRDTDSVSAWFDRVRQVLGGSA